MNINKISNNTFKGAYFVAGPGKSVKKAEIKIEDGLNGEGEIKRLAYGYTTDERPTYLLVTTGEDVKRYNDFALRKQQKYYDKLLNALPEQKTEEDFDSKHDYLSYKIARDGMLAVESIRENCDFTKEDEIYILQADDILNAAENGTFDYLTGEMD